MSVAVNVYMQNQPTPWIPEENPSLNGPDYVALVIEWDDVADDDEITQRIDRKPTALLQVAGATLGAVGAIALAAWGIHRLRAA